jgi:hypothetical protein
MLFSFLFLFLILGFILLGLSFYKASFSIFWFRSWGRVVSPRAIFIICIWFNFVCILVSLFNLDYITGSFNNYFDFLDLLHKDSSDWDLVKTSLNFRLYSIIALSSFQENTFFRFYFGLQEVINVHRSFCSFYAWNQISLLFVLFFLRLLLGLSFYFMWFFFDSFRYLLLFFFDFSGSSLTFFFNNVLQKFRQITRDEATLHLNNFFNFLELYLIFFVFYKFFFKSTLFIFYFFLAYCNIFPLEPLHCLLVFTWINSLFLLLVLLLLFVFFCVLPFFKFVSSLTSFLISSLLRQHLALLHFYSWSDYVRFILIPLILKRFKSFFFLFVRYRWHFFFWFIVFNFLLLFCLKYFVTCIISLCWYLIV